MLLKINMNISLLNPKCFILYFFKSIFTIISRLKKNVCSENHIKNTTVSPSLTNFF